MKTCKELAREVATRCCQNRYVVNESAVARIIYEAQLAAYHHGLRNGDCPPAPKDCPEVPAPEFA